MKPMKSNAAYFMGMCLLTIVALPSFVHGGDHTNEVDWAKLNPAFAGAGYVGDREVCASCHEGVMTKYDKTPHGESLPRKTRLSQEASDCETCHGPRSLHIEDPDSSLAFSNEQYSAVCMQCHQDGSRLYWQGDQHESSDVGCVSCHTVMEAKSPSALLKAANEQDVCATCHANVTAKMKRASRHPVTEGNLSCSSCHNPHGSAGQSMLVKGGISETCFGCHQDKRGPFIWEHPPVRENCLTCHEPHGSNNRNLLTTLSSTLCVSCHQYGGHINQYRYNRVSTPYGDGCANCHMTLHGSNHPSGAKFNR